MVNNFTNINKTTNHPSPQTNELTEVVVVIVGNSGHMYVL